MGLVRFCKEHPLPFALGAYAAFLLAAGLVPQGLVAGWPGYVAFCVLTGVVEEALFCGVVFQLLCAYDEASKARASGHRPQEATSAAADEPSPLASRQRRTQPGAASPSSSPLQNRASGHRPQEATSAAADEPSPLASRQRRARPGAASPSSSPLQNRASGHRRPRSWFPVVATALLFGMAHLTLTEGVGLGALKVVQATAFSLCMVLLFARTRNLAWPMLAHSAFDLAYFAAPFAKTGHLPPYSATISLDSNIAVLAATTLFFAICAAIMFKLDFKNRNIERRN